MSRAELREEFSNAKKISLKEIKENMDLDCYEPEENVPGGIWKRELSIFIEDGKVFFHYAPLSWNSLRDELKISNLGELYIDNGTYQTFFRKTQDSSIIAERANPYRGYINALGNSNLLGGDYFLCIILE